MIECKDNGIYGIYIIDNVHGTEELIYIGKTSTSFEDRFKSHMSKLKSKKNKKQLKLYNRIRQAKRAGLDVELRPMVQLDQVWWNRSQLYPNELAMMEIALIDYFKPECNWEGVSAPYLFNYERINYERQFENRCEQEQREI